MSFGNVFAKSCPQCGTVCPYAARSCIRCAFPFPVAATPDTVPVKRVLSIFAVLLTAGLIILVGTFHLLVTSTDAYAQAITLAKSSSEVQSLLGDGIRAQTPAIGFANGSNGSQFTEFSVRLVGSRTGGHLYGVANAVNGVWEFSRLSFLADRASRKIDLAPTRRRLFLPPVPVKKIYLIPAGLDSDESLDWAPAYYKAKLGIDVEVLPPTSLPNDLDDPRRHQLNSERFVERLYRSYPELAQDPSNILIGVTSRDIFIPSLGWSYAENYRRDDRLAVISSARFHPPTLLGRWNPEWFNSRFQKMLTKNIAILYFDLPMSSDYTSLLSGGVLSGREVDLMSGSIIGAEGRWDPFINSGDIEVTIYAVPGKPIVWRLARSREKLPKTSTHVFNADLTIGLFIYRKTDFRFDGDCPLQFTRAYRNQDDQSRPFGIGTNDSMDSFLVGQMGSYIDLVFEDGGRVHFVHAPAAAGQKGDTYLRQVNDGNLFSRAVFTSNSWTIERRDGPTVGSEDGTRKEISIIHLSQISIAFLPCSGRCVNEMNPSAIFEYKIEIAAHLSDKKTVHRIIGADTEGSGLVVLIAVGTGELKRAVAVKTKIGLAVDEETNRKIGIEDMSGGLGQYFARLGQPPNDRLAGNGVDGDFDVP